MSRLVVSLVTLVAFAGCASAPRQQARIDGSSEAAFKTSVESLRKALPTQRAVLLVIALQDVWRTAVAEAEPASSEADTAKAYFARLDGLGYREILSLADATPPTTQEQYVAMLPHGAQQAMRNPSSGSMSPQPMFSDPALYNLNGAPVGMPQYNTSCGTVCSR